MGKGLLREQSWVLYFRRYAVAAACPGRRDPSGKGGLSPRGSEWVLQSEGRRTMCGFGGSNCHRSSRERGGENWGRPQGRELRERAKLLRGNFIYLLWGVCSLVLHPRARVPSGQPGVSHMGLAGLPWSWGEGLARGVSGEVDPGGLLTPRWQICQRGRNIWPETCRSAAKCVPSLRQKERWFLKYLHHAFKFFII